MILIYVPDVWSVCNRVLGTPTSRNDVFKQSFRTSQYDFCGVAVWEGNQDINVHLPTSLIVYMYVHVC